MKMNSKKIIVSTLALVMGAALAGSISGTVAWYQYSTRSTVAFNGASAHCTENLQIRIRQAGQEFKSDLTTKDIADYLTSISRTNANKLTPVTPAAGSLAADAVASSFKAGAEYQKAIANWRDAGGEDYIVLPLELRVRDNDGKGSSFLAKKIYLSDLTIAAARSNDAAKADMSSAVRVGIESAVKADLPSVNNISDIGTVYTSATDGDLIFIANENQYYEYDGTESAWVPAADQLTAYTTFSKTGEDVNAYGSLDLNDNGELDRTEIYEWDNRKVIIYGLEADNYLNVIGDYADEAHLPTSGMRGGDLATIGDQYYQYAGYGDGWVKIATPTGQIVSTDGGAHLTTLPSTPVDLTSAPVLKATKASKFAEVDDLAGLPAADAHEGETYFVKDTDANPATVTPGWRKSDGSDWQTVASAPAGIANDTNSLDIYGAKELGTTSALDVTVYEKTADRTAVSPTVGKACYDKEAGKYFYCKEADAWGDPLTSIEGEMSDLCLKVDVKIYLEGWQVLAASASSVENTATWNEKAIEALFNVGLRFSSEGHGANH